MNCKTTLSTLALATLGVFSTANVLADELKFLCYQDANECEVLSELASRPRPAIQW